jgi:transcriptional regulator with XRE-family HTH domain
VAISISLAVGRRIQKLRETEGWTQEYLAVTAGIGRAHLSQIENGAVSPRIDTIDAVTQCFGISLAEFFREL